MASTKVTASELSRAIVNTDYLLIVAAAGLSISPTLPNNPYHSDADFARHYPRLAKEFGYKNAFMAMGLSQDPQVPEPVKAAFGASHWINMTEKFPPTEGYSLLREMCSRRHHHSKRNRNSKFSQGAVGGSSGGDDDDLSHVFCWTSNVDQCFARSGFPPEQVYTSQGEMNKLQCLRCNNIWNCTENLHRIVAASGTLEEMELKDMTLANTCPKCGQRDKIVPNLRGGSWFDHSPYLPQQEALIAFLSKIVSSGVGQETKEESDNEATSAEVAAPTFTVLEIGVGPSTPVVTSLPASRFAIAAALNGVDVSYIRINPDRRCDEFCGNPQNTYDTLKERLSGGGNANNTSSRGNLRYTLLPSTWTVLEEVAKAGSQHQEGHKGGGEDAQEENGNKREESGATSRDPQFVSEDVGSIFQSAVQMMHNIR